MGCYVIIKSLFHGCLNVINHTLDLLFTEFKHEEILRAGGR